MFSRWNAPSAGEVQKSWLPNPPITVTTTTSTPTEKNGLGDDDQEMAIDSPASQAPTPGNMPQREMDYDVAEDDSWGA